nr:hypothetical protein [Escherichia coli]
MATIIKSLSEKTAALETHSADTVLRKKLVNSIVMKNTDFKHVITADIENNIYDLLKLRVQQDEGIYLFRKILNFLMIASILCGQMLIDV